MRETIRRVSQATIDRLDAMDREQARSPEDVGAAMQGALSSGDWLQIERALTLLPAAALSDARWQEFLIDALLHDDSFVRQAAAEAVGRLGFSVAIPALLRLLHDPDYLVRVCAVEALGEVGDCNAQDAIAALLQDRRPLVRGYAAMALAELGCDGASQVLDARLQRERNSWARAHIQLALYSLGRRQLLPLLLRKLTSKDMLVRSSMANSIEILASDPSNWHLVRSSVEAALAREVAEDGHAVSDLQRARDYVRRVCEDPM